MLRDTSHDWKGIAAEPFYGVLSHPEWYRENLTPDKLDQFWESGRAAVRQILVNHKDRFGEFQPKSAIDYGCGVGRLTRAIAEQVDRAIGIDVAQGMIDEAAIWSDPDIEYRLDIPDEKVDWINSIIVFQHIHPEIGFRLLRDLLDRLNPGGGISIQLTIFQGRISLQHG